FVEHMNLGDQSVAAGIARRDEQARLRRRTLADRIALPRMQPLTEHRLDGGFPTRVYAQLLPELRRARQRVALEPFLERRIAFRVGLNLLEGCELRLGRRVLALGDTERLGRLRKARLQRGALALERLERALPGLEIGVLLRRVGPQRVERRRIGQRETLQFVGDPLAPLRYALAGAADMRLVGARELQPALRLLELAARLVKALAGGAQRFLGLR